MRYLVCGDRFWGSEFIIAAVFEEFGIKSPDVVIEGEAEGADKMARLLAESLGIGVLPFPADWKRFHRAAGPIRNRQMLKEGDPDVVLAFHNDLRASKGTRDMCKQALRASKLVFLVSENAHRFQGWSLSLLELDGNEIDVALELSAAPHV